MTTDAIRRHIADATEHLLQSYETLGGINRVGRLSLPSRQAAAQILHHVDSLFFPGFVRDEPVSTNTLPFVTAHRLSTLYTDVAAPVAQNIAFNKAQIAQGSAVSSSSTAKNTVNSTDTDCSENSIDVDTDTLCRNAHMDASVDAEASDFALRFIAALPALRAQVALDVEALYQGDPACQSRAEVILAYPGLRATLVHRIAHFFWTNGAKLIARMMSEIAHSETGVDIHPGAQIGSHFHIDHGTGIVVGETTVIGNHVKIYQGVSLGALSVSRKKAGQKRHPTIEDHVTLYAGATILGGDTVVGHNSVIGGNVWLVQSVPPYSIVENDPRIKVGSKNPA